MELLTPSPSATVLIKTKHLPGQGDVKNVGASPSPFVTEQISFLTACGNGKEQIKSYLFHSDKPENLDCTGGDPGKNIHERG